MSRKTFLLCVFAILLGLGACLAMELPWDAVLEHPQWATRALSGAAAWGCVLGLLGFARHCLNAGGAALSYLRESSLPIYILHSTMAGLFDAAGEQILKINAQFRTFHILGALDYAISGAYRTEPSFQRYLSARAEALQEQGIDVDIWKY